MKMNPDFKPPAHEREKWNYIEIYVQDNINCEKAQYTAPIPVIDNWCGSPMKQCQSLCTDSPCVHTMFNTTQGFLVSPDYRTTNTKYKYKIQIYKTKYTLQIHTMFNTA